MEYTHHAAAIIIRDRRILLLKRAREEAGAWCPPIETLAHGETPESAVVRGAHEGAGLHFALERALPYHHYGAHTTHVFLGAAEGEVALNPDETADSAWLTYGEASQLPMAFGYNRLMGRLRADGLL